MYHFKNNELSGLSYNHRNETCKRYREYNPVGDIDSRLDQHNCKTEEQEPHQKINFLLCMNIPALLKRTKTDQTDKEQQPKESDIEQCFYSTQ